MKSFSVLFLLWLLNIGLVHAQNTDSLTNNIITTPKFREGVYRSFEEFKNNNPSIVEGFEILDEPGKFEHYKLVLDKGVKATYVFGFCDGETLYINNSRGYSNRGPFVRILIRGALMYYEDFSTKTSALAAHYSSGLGITGVLIAAAIVSDYAKKNPGWIIYMPDDTGDGILLDKKNVKSILKETDKELYEEYMQHAVKNDFETLFDFIIRYNKRMKAK